jgi:hypothetical protein
MCQLQNRLDKAATLQTENYPLRRMGNKSRKELYPALYTNSRTFSSNNAAFDLCRVQQYLSREVVFVRKVSKKGAINFYAQSVYVGSRYQNRYVCVRYNAELNHFSVEEQESRTAISWFTADNFNQDNIIKLAVCQHRYVKCYNFTAQ